MACKLFTIGQVILVVIALITAQRPYTFETCSSSLRSKPPPCYSDGLKTRYLPKLANHTSHLVTTLVRSR